MPSDQSKIDFWKHLDKWTEDRMQLEDRMKNLFYEVDKSINMYGTVRSQAEPVNHNTTYNNAGSNTSCRESVRSHNSSRNSSRESSRVKGQQTRSDLSVYSRHEPNNLERSQSSVTSLSNLSSKYPPTGKNRRFMSTPKNPQL